MTCRAKNVMKVLPYLVLKYMAASAELFLQQPRSASNASRMVMVTQGSMDCPCSSLYQGVYSPLLSLIDSEKSTR
jgi:hypothetical protein